MAALQQSPVAFHAKSPPSTPKTPLPKSIRGVSFSSSLSSLQLLKSSIKLTTTKTRLNHHRRSTVIKMLDTAASRYATALAEVAMSAGTLDATVKDLEKLEKVFSDPGVYKFFTNPTLDVEEKFKLIEEMNTSMDLLPTTRNFLCMLIDSNRIDLINDMIRDFEIIYNRFTDTELAVVTSVVKLESQHLAQIAKEVQGLTGAKNVRIKTALDPSLIAGFTIRYGNAGSKIIDMSVKKQLEDIAEQIDVGEIDLAPLI